MEVINLSQKSNIPLSNPILNEFVYTVLYESTYQEKRGLTGRYLRAAMGAKAAKAFVQNSTLEEKLIVLTHFGVKWFMIFCKENTVNLAELKQIISKYDGAHKNPRALKDISDAKLFITSDKEMAHLMGIVSQSASHPSFFPNMTLARTAYQIKKWPKRNTNETDIISRELMEHGKFLTGFLLSCMHVHQHAMAYFKISSPQLLIIQYFYIYLHSYVSKDTAYIKFAGFMTKTKFTFHLKRCIELQLLQKSAKERFEYTITAQGILKVNDLMDAVIKANNFKS